MKRIIGFILLNMVFFFGFSQRPHTIDSALINQSDSLADLADELLTSSYIDSARTTTDYMLQFCEDIGYEIGVGQAYSSYSNIYSMIGNNTKSFEYDKLAAELFEKNHAYRRLAIIHYNIGGTLYDDGQYLDALEYVGKAHDYFLETDDRPMLSRSKANMGAMLIRMGAPLEKILIKLKAAEQIAKEDEDMMQICHVLNNKGIAYVKANKNIDKGINDFLESTHLQRQHQIQNDFIKGFSYSGLSDALYLKQDYKKSLLYNDTAIIAFQNLQYRFGLKDVYSTRMNIYASLGDYKNAFETMKLFNTHKDTLYNQERSKQLNSLRTAYETDQKEAEIALLSQQSSIQTLEIKQKNQTILIGAIAFLFILTLTFFIYQQRSARRIHNQTELEQRFLRSQLNPHFISNALVAVQSFMLKNDSHTAALYLTKFAKLMREILENSRKEFILVEEEVSMLQNYLDIHKLRLGSFDFIIDLDDSIDSEIDTIPPMFVQPFVENAVEHGIMNTQDGKIEIKLRKEQEYISIEVNDNGKGISSGGVIDHVSLSSTIIKERMDLFNKSLKKKIQLVMSNLKDTKGEVIGTRVALKVPFSHT